jgi:hypothetical protein
MVMKDGTFDWKKRAAEKQASRDRDFERLRNGEVTPEELARENDFFAALDLADFKIVAMGGKPFRKGKKKT